MKVNLTQVAADITKFGGLGVSVFEVLANTLPNVRLNDGAQAVLSAVVALVTALLSYSKANAVAAAKAETPTE